MRIRVESSDINQIVTLFYETVHSVNAKDYSMKQLNMLGSEARKLGISIINTAASITAKPFF